MPLTRLALYSFIVAEANTVWNLHARYDAMHGYLRKLSGKFGIVTKCKEWLVGVYILPAVLWNIFIAITNALRCAEQIIAVDILAKIWKHPNWLSAPVDLE